MFFRRKKQAAPPKPKVWRPEEVDFFGIYIHWPYCAKICPYCDFNVYAAKTRDNSALLDAISRDLEAHRTLTGPKRVTSIYFGGGTPSLLRPEDIYAILGKISGLWPVSAAVEITLEANPEDVFPGSLSIWKSIGVNRLSLGVQSLNDDALRFLGRAHSRDDAFTAIEQSLGVFPNTSVDLIYARPGQTEADWLTELGELISTGIPHLSLYELTIKEKTAFAKQVEREQFTPMDDDAQADLYERTLESTAKAGLPAYEVSNHAKSEDYWSRHNLTYWLGGDWIGIGPGAEGRFNAAHTHDRVMSRAQRKPADYIQQTEETGMGWEESEPLSPVDDANERLIMGLRSKLGVSRRALETRYGQPISEEKIDRFMHTGHLKLVKGRLILTEPGWLLADYIASELSPVS